MGLIRLGKEGSWVFPWSLPKEQGERESDYISFVTSILLHHNKTLIKKNQC